MKIKKAQSLKKMSFSLKEPGRRLLVADDDTTLARVISDYFTGQGFDVRITYTVAAAREIVEFWQPDYIMVDLMLPHTNALSLLKFLSTKPLAIKPRVIVMSKPTISKGIEAVKKAGAIGYLIKPFQLEDAMRLVDPRRAPVPAPVRPSPAPVVKPKDTLDPTTKALLRELHLVNLFLKQALDVRKPSENLFNLMRMVSLKIKGARCSFIRIMNSDTGVVMASNDDPSVTGLPIQLHKYPEIRDVMRTKQVLLIPDVASSELMAHVWETMKHTKFESIAVFPIFVRAKFFGVTSLRMPQKSPVDMFYIDHFGQLAAQVLSLAVITDPADRALEAAG